MSAYIEKAMTFQEFINDRGFGHQEIIFDEQIHRFKPHGSKVKSAWYIAFRNLGFESGVVGDWKSGSQENFCSKKKSTLTQEQRRQYAQEMAKKDEKNRIDIIKRHLTAKNEVGKIWSESSTKKLDNHRYLVNKKINPSNIRKNADGDIVIPIYDSNRILWSLQTIKPNGIKLFHKGGKINGCYHPIGFSNNILPQIILCEGYSTGTSIYQATSIPTAVCFSANNLESVAKLLRVKYPKTKIIIAGDDDQFNSINIGRNKSFIAAKQVNASAIFPVFKDLSTKPTDFNDLLCLEGLEAVKKQFIEVCDVF